MDNPNAVAVHHEKIFQGWSEEQINTIRNTVAKDANDYELKMFLELASKYKLDPFKKEIVLIQSKGKNSIYITRDGLLNIADRNPNFRGMDSDVVYEGDKFLKDENGVHHVCNFQVRGAPIGAYALVYRKDRDIPTYVFAPMKDYDRHRDAWDDKPHAMILKVAQAQALKIAFGFSSFDTPEENNVTSAEKKQAIIDTGKKYTEKASIKTAVNDIWQKFLQVFDGDKQKAKEKIEFIIGVKPSSTWTGTDLLKLAVWLEQFAAPDPEQVLDAQAEIKEAVNDIIETETPNSEKTTFESVLPSQSENKNPLDAELI